MDEELKKTIEDLSASVKTIQTDLSALKKDHEVTPSDTSSSQAGSQGSDTVSGNGPTKKRKRISEDDSESKEEVEPGDADTESYQLSEAARAFIEMTFKSKLTRKARATKYGVQGG